MTNRFAQTFTDNNGNTQRRCQTAKEDWRGNARRDSDGNESDQCEWAASGRSEHCSAHSTFADMIGGF